MNENQNIFLNSQFTKDKLNKYKKILIHFKNHIKKIINAIETKEINHSVLEHLIITTGKYYEKYDINIESDDEKNSDEEEDEQEEGEEEDKEEEGEEEEEEEEESDDSESDKDDEKDSDKDDEKDSDKDDEKESDKDDEKDSDKDDEKDSDKDDEKESDKDDEKDSDKKIVNIDNSTTSSINLDSDDNIESEEGSLNMKKKDILLESFLNEIPMFKRRENVNYDINKNINTFILNSYVY